ncbi:MAG: methyltransferase domain-containing protein [Deltaproteobacteria bacterium]|nr:methyltransferase domain-containing protein [Deltaproteobacteria bacterium]
MIPIESLLPLLRDPADGGYLLFEPDGTMGGGTLVGVGSAQRYAVHADVADFVRAEREPPSVAQRVMEAKPFAEAYRRFWREHGLPRMLRWPLDLESEHTLWRALLAPAAGLPLLDLSCGAAPFTWWLARDHAGDPVIGLDVSRAMLDEALAREERRDVHEISFVRGDATRLPFADASFGGVLNLTALHLYPDPDAVFREVRRVLVPGGVYVVTSILPRAMVTPMGLAQRVAGRVSGMRLHGEEALRARLVSAGFDTFERIVLGGSLLVVRASIAGSPSRTGRGCATCPSRDAEGRVPTTEPPPPDPEEDPPR